jgi:hypothetical protein
MTTQKPHFLPKFPPIITVTLRGGAAACERRGTRSVRDRSPLLFTLALNQPLWTCHVFCLTHGFPVMALWTFGTPLTLRRPSCVLYSVSQCVGLCSPAASSNTPRQLSEPKHLQTSTNIPWGAKGSFAEDHP